MILNWFDFDFYGENTDLLYVSSYFNYLYLNKYKTEIKQGETKSITVEVMDFGNIPVNIVNPDVLICNLIIKGYQYAGFQSGLTSAYTFNNGESTYQNITSYSNNKIIIDLNRNTTKNFPKGEIIASVLIKKGNDVKEYNMLLGICYKGQLKDNNI